MVMEKQDMRDKLEGIGEEVPPGGEGIANVEHFMMQKHEYAGLSASPNKSSS